MIFLLRIAKEYEKNNYKLPLFIKPIDGSRSVDTYVINKESDLTQYHFENDKLMFLEYIDHKLYDEYTCDLYYNQNHTLKCVVPRKRVEVRDGEVNKGLTSNNEIVAYVKERLNYISGAIGCLTAQFFLNKTNGNIYGIEINPRFGGGFPLSYLAGANFPGWIIQEVYADKTVDDKFDVWEDNLLMLRYDDEILVHGYKG
jgi:carbamoyl-phosphate synthase large subunit